MSIASFKSEIENKLNEQVPALLFPVKLETCFMRVQTSGSNGEVEESFELWIRIFPDQISIEQHDPRLTETEAGDGQKYWETVWNAPEDRSVRFSAWTNLTTKYGSNRAAWIIKKMTPTNLRDLPIKQKESGGGTNLGGGGKGSSGRGKDTPLGTGDFGNNDPVFRNLSNQERREENDASAAKVCTFPDRFVALLYVAGETTPAYEVVGNPIYTDSEELVMGLTGDEALLPEYDEDGKVIVEYQDAEGNLKEKPNAWLFDFAKAVERGLGFRIPISEAEGKAGTGTGFSRVLVFGLRYTKDKIESKRLLENLFDQHHYSHQGLAFLRPGTPTNNTQDGSSAYTGELDAEMSYQTEVIGARFDTSQTSPYTADGQVFGRALGIDERIFEHIENSAQHAMGNALWSNMALWQTTMGYYLEQVLGYADFKLATDIQGLDNERHWLAMIDNGAYVDWIKVWDLIREFMTDHVSARGMIPSIRVGKQPYGVITTGTDASIQGWMDHMDQTVFLKKMLALINSIIDTFNELIVEKMETVDDPVDGENTLEKIQKRFLDALDLLPTSEKFYNRYGVGTSGVFADIMHEDSYNSWADQLRDTVLSGNFPSTTFELGDSLGLSFIQWISQETPLSTWVDELKGKEDRLLPPVDNGNRNYIEGLLNWNWKNIFSANQTDGFTSPAILYRLLKSALFNALWDAASRILEKIELRDYRFDQIIEEDGPAGGKDWRTMNWGQFKAYRNSVDYPTDSMLDIKSLILKYKPGYKGPFSVGEAINKSLIPDSAVLYEYSTALKFSRTSHQDFITGLNQKGLGDRSILMKEYSSFLSYSSDPDSYSQIGTLNSFQNNLSKSPFVYAKSPFPFLFEPKFSIELAGLSTSDSMTLAEYLQDPALRQHYPDETATLNETLEAMEWLSKLPTAELERLLAEHIDLCSYRLDAWKQGFFNKILHTIRSKNNHEQGIYIGAFAVVYDLGPGAPRKDLDGNEIYYNANGENPMPPATDGDNQGFIHAPGINHAINAAILRSGYGGTGNNQSLEINLSSRRVRQARSLMDGINRGQPLGALLGYRLERKLHEQELDKFILELRDGFPLISGHLTEHSGPTQVVEAHNVPDGLALLEAIKKANDKKAYLKDQILYKAPAENDEIEKVLVVLDELAGELDAVGDLVMAEGAFQVVSGNYPRSQAIMQAFTEGKHIPEPDIIHTPRSGHLLTHRVGLLLYDEQASLSEEHWPGELSPRAQAEPRLNNWLAGVIGSTAEYYFQVNYKLAGSESSKTFQLRDLVKDQNLNPIDLLHLFPEDLDAPRQELEQRILYGLIRYLKSEGQWPAAFKLVNIELESFPASGTPLSDLIQMLSPLRQLLSGSRPMRPSDLVHPESIEDPDTDSENFMFSELMDRTQRFTDHFQQTLNALNSSLNSGTIAYESLIDGLWRICDFGVPEAIPTHLWASEDLEPEQASELKAQAQSVLELSSKKLIEITTMANELKSPPNGKPLSTRKKLQGYQSIFQNLLGPKFILLPRIKVANGEELKNAYDAQNELLAFCRKDENDGPLVLQKWLSQHGRVREQIDSLEEFHMLHELLFHADFSPAVLQLPFQQQNYSWIGATLPGDYFEKHEENVSKQKLSLLLQGNFNSSHLDGSNQAFGLCYDDWTEMIPEESETSGIAFHYDQPNAKAPQAMLLVTPRNSAQSNPHTYQHFIDSIDNTLEMMKLRLVEPDHFASKNLTQLKFFWYSLPAVVRDVTNDRAVQNDHS